MTGPDLAHRWRAAAFQAAAERAFPGRPVLATVAPFSAVDRLPMFAWEVELSDSCERAARYLPAGADVDPAAVARELRATLQTAHHLGMRERMWSLSQIGK